MNIVKILVTSYRVHIGVKTVANVEMILLEGKSFPLCKRVNDLTALTDSGNIKADGTLKAVEVIVKTRALGDEKRSGYTLKVKRCRKSRLEGLLYE